MFIMESNPGSIVIIGSMKSSREDILEAEDHFQSMGFTVLTPIKNRMSERESLRTKQERFLNWMDEAEFIVAVRKPDGSIGESTSYEIAYAHHINKIVLIWNDGHAIYEMI